MSDPDYRYGPFGDRELTGYEPAMKAEIEELRSAYVLQAALFESVMRAIRGETVSDFEASHGPVYEALILREANMSHARITGELRAEVENLKAQLAEARATKDMHKERQERLEMEVHRLTRMIAEDPCVHDATAEKRVVMLERLILDWVRMMHTNGFEDSKPFWKSGGVEQKLYETGRAILARMEKELSK